jgi:hypothetical protein
MERTITSSAVSGDFVAPASNFSGVRNPFCSASDCRSSVEAQGFSPAKNRAQVGALAPATPSYTIAPFTPHETEGRLAGELSVSSRLGGIANIR